MCRTPSQSNRTTNKIDRFNPINTEHCLSSPGPWNESKLTSMNHLDQLTWICTFLYLGQWDHHIWNIPVCARSNLNCHRNRIWSNKGPLCSPHRFVRQEQHRVWMVRHWLAFIHACWWSIVCIRSVVLSGEMRFDWSWRMKGDLDWSFFGWQPDHNFS